MSEQHRLIIVELDVYGKKERDNNPLPWSFALTTLILILDKLFASPFAKKWDYQFKVRRAYRVDQADENIGA